jgi:voltage-gated potassium channel
MDTTAIQPQIGDFPFTGECQAALDALECWKNKLLDAAVDRPAETLLVVLTGAAMVFYLAEREVNDRVESYGDALHYISTCLSVGYANLFPMTQTGKLVATIVMAIGPALTSWIIEGRLVARTSQAQAAATEVETAAMPTRPDFTPVVEKLDAILQEMRAQRGQQTPEA